MKHLKDFLRQDVGKTLAMTVGSPSAHRRGTMLKHVAFLLLFLFAGFGQVWATEIVYKQTIFSADNNSQCVQNYTSTWTNNTDDFVVTTVNANNNNNGWSGAIKIGTKTNASTGTITTNTAIDKAITKVVLTIDAMAYANNVTSITLKTSSNGSSWTSAGTFTKEVGAKTVTIGSPTANLYYQIEVVCTGASKNGCIQLSQIDFYAEEGGTPEPSVCDDPVFEPDGGSVTSSTPISISTTTEGATIYYTVDGSTPDANSTAYSSSFTISESKTIKAIAIKEGNSNSAVVEKTFTVAAALADADFAWSASEYEATLGGENTFPSLTNNQSLNVTYESTTPAIATIDANGVVTPVKAGTTTIKAIFAGNSSYVAKTVSYDLTVVKGPDSNTQKTIDMSVDETTTASDSKLEWVGTYVTVTANKAEASTATNNYYPGTSGQSYKSTRFYKNSTLTFTPVNGYKITSIVFSATSNSYASALKNSNWTNATASMEEGNDVTVLTVTASGAGDVSATIGGTCGFTQIVINYAVDQKYAVAFEDPTGGTLTIKDGSDAITSGDTFSEGKELTVEINPTGTYIGGAIEVKKTSDNSKVTAYVLEDGVLTVPAYGITVSASFTPTYAIETECTTGTVSYTIGDAVATRAQEDAEVTIVSSPDSNHEGDPTIIVKKKSDNTDISEAVTLVDNAFLMPAYDVIVSVTYDEKEDPYIAATVDDVAITEVDFGTVDQNASVTAKSFSLNGDNLTEGSLSLALLYGDNFTVSPTSIDVNGTLSAQTITITPITGLTATADTYEDILTISGGGVAQNAELNIDIKLIVTPTYTVNWIVNGDTEHPYATQTAVEGTDLNIPSNPTATSSCAGLVFKGWVASPLANAVENEEDVDFVTPSTMPENGATYYAVFAEQNGGGDNEETYTFVSFEQADEVTISAPTSFDIKLKKNNGSTAPQWNSNASEGRVYASGSMEISSTSDIKEVLFTYTLNAGGKNKDQNVTIAVAGNSNAGTWDSENKKWTGNDTKVILTASGTAGNVGFTQVKVKTNSSITYSNFVTTCVACSRVNLEAETVENGSIKFQQDSKDITSVKTCDGAQTVNVVAEPATGYELTDVTLSSEDVTIGTDGANYENGAISIPEDAAGTLTATATFAQKNHTVTIVKNPSEAGEQSELSNKHYDDNIVLTIDVPTGYIFNNWTSNDVTITNATSATEASFTMPDKDVTVTANFTAVHNVAWAIVNTPATGSLDGVYVKGIVTAITEINTTQYYNATYSISDVDENGTPINSYIVFRAKNVGNTNYAANSELTEGDEVIVTGDLTTYQGVKEFKQGCYIIANGRTAASISSIVISGTPAKTEYSANESFTREGLSATAVYNTGYKKDVSAAATWTYNDANAYTVTADATVQVKATWSEVESDAFSVDVTVSSKTLESIELSETELTGYVGQAMPKPVTVTAHFDENGTKSTENVTAFAQYSNNYDATITTAQTITVSYQFGEADPQTADYTVTLSSVRNTINTAYTVSKGRQIIDLDNTEGNELNLAAAGNKVFVAGYITAISGTTYTIKDNATDDEFIEIAEATLATGVTDVEVGNLIKVEGNLFFYENNTHTVTKYQITNGEIVWKQPKVEIEVENQSMEVEATWTIVATITPSEASVTYSIKDDGQSNTCVSLNTETNVITALAPGTATIVASAEAYGDYLANEVELTVTVTPKVVHGSITYVVNGGSAVANVTDATNLPDPLPEPTKDGYTFGGWFTDDNTFANAVSAGDALEGNIILYAKWIEIPVWARTYTSNVSVAQSQGSFAAEKVVINNKEYDAWKAGSSNNTGSIKVTVPAGTAALHFHAFSWGGKTAPTISISGVTETPSLISLTADAGANNNSPYTLQNTPLSQYFSITFDAVESETDIIFAKSGTGDNRFFLYGVNALYPEISLDLDTKAFGKVSVGENKTQVFTISKNELVTGTLTASVVDANVDNIFTVSEISGDKVTVTFTPATVDADYSATLQVTNGIVSATATLTGRGKDGSAPEIVVTETAVDFGRVDPNASVSESVNVQLHNIDGSVNAAIGGTNADKFALNEYSIDADGAFVITPTTTENGIYAATLTLTATDAESVVIPITMTVASKWALKYTSNVALTAVTSESVSSNVIIEGVTYDALKANKAQPVKFTVPKNTTAIHVHMVAWSGESANVTVSGNCFTSSKSVGSLSENTNVSGGGTTYDLRTGSTAMSYYYELTPDNEITQATEITITAATNKRFVLFGVNQEGGIAEVEKTTTPISEIGDDVTVIVPAGKTLVIDESASQKGVVVESGAKVIVEATLTSDSLIVEDGAVVELEETVSTPIFRITAAPGQESVTSSGELYGAQHLAVPTGDIYMDFQLVASGMDADYWYSISAPFNVNVNNDIYNTNGDRLINNTHIQVWEFAPDQYANGGRGWKRVNQMKRGMAYLIGFDETACAELGGVPSVVRLRANLTALVADLPSFDLVQQDGTSSDPQRASYAYNGLSNPNTHHVGVTNQYQYYDNVNHQFQLGTTTNLVVGTPFFCAYSTTTTVVTLGNTPYAAPMRNAENEYKFNVQIRKPGSIYYDNQMCVRASEDALSTFEEGKDMVTMNDACSPTAAVIWTNAYGKRLAIQDAPLTNNQAMYDLTIMTPKAGTYVLRQANEVEGADLYVTYQGQIVWNLSLGDYELDLTRGTTTGYGLLLVVQPNQMPTGVENGELLNGENGVQKILLNGNLYILRDGHVYDAVGKQAR